MTTLRSDVTLCLQSCRCWSRCHEWTLKLTVQLFIRLREPSNRHLDKSTHIPYLGPLSLYIWCLRLEHNRSIRPLGSCERHKCPLSSLDAVKSQSRRYRMVQFSFAFILNGCQRSFTCYTTELRPAACALLLFPKEHFRYGAFRTNRCSFCYETPEPWSMQYLCEMTIEFDCSWSSNVQYEKR